MKVDIMQAKSPLFSIVIPTRNRSHLLGGALKSALEQDFDDYEVVVVANNCQDNTREVVERLQTERVKYYETDKTLTMPANWEFAWTKASGQYVTYLPDDDALVPTTLSFLAKNTLKDKPPVISWEDAIYYYPHWHDKKTQNILLLFFYGDAVIEDVPSEIYRQQCAQFSFAWNAPIPKLLNCAVHREFFEAWRGQLGLLFFPVAPDYSFAWIATQICSTIRVVHRPLTVRGISDYSIGSNAGMGEAGQEFYREFGNFDFFAETLVRIPTTLNQLAATFLRVNAAFRQAGVAPEPLDWESFLLAATRQFKEVQAWLPDWPLYVPQLLTTAQKFSPKLYAEVQTILAASSVGIEEGESLHDLRLRTARMALDYAPNLKNATSKHMGDAQCGRCILGLEKGLLAESAWAYLYVFGDDLGASSPYDMSLQVNRYYELLLRCREKQKKALAGKAKS